MAKKIILAYSGGVDTSICIHWLQSVKGFKVITFLAQLGQIEYLEPVGEKAIGIGASSAHINDLRESFIKEFIFPALKANARYESGYLLSSALNRPLIAQELVRLAAEESCDYVAHGSRGIGNDHIRLDNAIHTLAPGLNIFAPLRDLSLRSIKNDIVYARQHHIPIERVKHALYNIEHNLWGVNILLGPVTNKWEEAPRDTFIITTALLETPDKPTVVKIGFKRGEPVSLDEEKLPALKLIEQLNKIGGQNAIGRVDMIEHQISGEKTREIYEAPAATILYAAHTALEEIILDKDLLHFKEPLSRKYGELIYNGQWFSPLRVALDKFFEDTQQYVTGSVKLKLFKGNLSLVGLSARQASWKRVSSSR